MDLFHVLNRGIDGRLLFQDTADYARFVHDLFEFNDTRPAVDYSRRGAGNHDVGPPRSYLRKRLVDIHGWVLMQDHYHLLLSEMTEGGLSKFVMKINVGLAKYHNEKYARHGHLFQGKTKKVLIDSPEHFLYILHYIHLNPLDYLEGAKDWRIRDTQTIQNLSSALEYLDQYRWSSYLDYSGKKNFPSLMTKRLFEKKVGEYAQTLRDYISDATNQTTMPFAPLDFLE